MRDEDLHRHIADILMPAGMKERQAGYALQHVDECTLRSFIRLMLEDTSSGYIAIVLDRQSRDMLLEYIHPMHENVTADHVTLIHSPSSQELSMFNEGEPVHVRVIGTVADSRGQVAAVRLPNFLMHVATRQPHITISTAPGVKQVYSNTLIMRRHDHAPALVLRGHIRHVA